MPSFQSINFRLSSYISNRITGDNRASPELKSRFKDSFIRYLHVSGIQQVADVVKLNDGHKRRMINS